MKKELINRIFTSLVLLPILFAATYYSGVFLILLLTIFYILASYEIIRNSKSIVLIFLSNVLLILSFYSFFYLRGNTEYSFVILIWILISTFFSDMGGYIFGKLIKGKKLTKISPNKTYSGAIGSVILSCTALPLLNFFQYVYFNLMIINFFELKFLIITFLISIVCQFGDLVVSFWKRKMKIKNLSNILPGHGGVLDRIDGLIFVLIFCIILKVSKII
jgi:phosphatidate cytidylyltransferase